MWCVGLHCIPANDLSSVERLTLVQLEPGSTNPAASGDAYRRVFLIAKPLEQHRWATSVRAQLALISQPLALSAHRCPASQSDDHTRRVTVCTKEQLWDIGQASDTPIRPR
jgi:hypothetical protein